MNLKTCPVCKSRVGSSRLRAHLQKKHKLNHVPSRHEANQRKWIEKKRCWKAEIKVLILRVRHGDASAMPALKKYMRIPVARKMIERALTNNKRGKFSRTQLPSGGRSVQGGSPGLGKKS